MMFYEDFYIFFNNFSKVFEGTVLDNLEPSEASTFAPMAEHGLEHRIIQQINAIHWTIYNIPNT